MNNEYPYYTAEELALRNGNDMPEIWVAYKGYIYDVTESDLFEGGEHFFHPSGVDLTEEMDEAPHPDDVMDAFPIVGKLKQ